MAVMPPAYRTIPKSGSRFSRMIMRRLIERVQHSISWFQAMQIPLGSFRCLTEIVMFLPPGLENRKICPLNRLVSYALKHVIFANGP
jgi:hypothetical protein